MPKNTRGKKVVPMKETPPRSQAQGLPHANVQFTPPSKMTPEEQAKFLAEHPTRQEVANFVSAYLSTEFLPALLNHINSQDNHNLGLISVCQAVLISQGIISQEDMAILIANWQKEQAQAMQAVAAEDAAQPTEGDKQPEPGTIPGVVK